MWIVIIQTRQPALNYKFLRTKFIRNKFPKKPRCFLNMDTEKIRDKTDNKSYEIEEMFNKNLGTDMNYRHSYIWPLVIGHAVLQASWFVGLYSVIFHAKLATTIWGKYQT